jgi:REP element-mobilizing transposase RayT
LRDGQQPPNPELAAWCQSRLEEPPFILIPEQRERVDVVCRAHAILRGWTIHALNVRSNHVHVVVTSDKAGRVTRDQFKANTTRVLREPPNPVDRNHFWTRGGDCREITDDAALAAVVEYVTNRQ